jgi:hypothetical protein
MLEHDNLQTAMHDDICSPFKWILERRRSKCWIYYQSSANGMNLKKRMRYGRWSVHLWRSGTTHFIRIVLYIPGRYHKVYERRPTVGVTYLDSPMGFNGVSSQQRVPCLKSSSIPIISTSWRVFRYSAIVLWYPWYPFVMAMHLGWQDIRAWRRNYNQTR